MIDSCFANYSKQPVLIIETCWEEYECLNKPPNLDVIYLIGLGCLFNLLNVLYFFMVM